MPRKKLLRSWVCLKYKLTGDENCFSIGSSLKSCKQNHLLHHWSDFALQWVGQLLAWKGRVIPKRIGHGANVKIFMHKKYTDDNEKTLKQFFSHKKDLGYKQRKFSYYTSDIRTFGHNSSLPRMLAQGKLRRKMKPTNFSAESTISKLIAGR